MSAGDFLGGQLAKPGTPDPVGPGHGQCCSGGCQPPPPVSLLSLLPPGMAAKQGGWHCSGMSPSLPTSQTHLPSLGWQDDWVAEGEEHDSQARTLCSAFCSHFGV